MGKIDVKQAGVVAFVYLVVFFVVIVLMHSTRSDYPVVKLRNDSTWIYISAKWQVENGVRAKQFDEMNSVAVIDLKRSLPGYVDGKYKIEPHSDQTMAMQTKMNLADEFSIFLSERPIVPATVNFSHEYSLVGVSWHVLLTVYTIVFTVLLYIFNKYIFKDRYRFGNASSAILFMMFLMLANRQVVGYWISVKELGQNRVVVQSAATVELIRANKEVWRKGKWFLGEKQVSSGNYMAYELSAYPKADSLQAPDLVNLIHYRAGDIVVKPGPKYKPSK